MYEVQVGPEFKSRHIENPGFMSINVRKGTSAFEVHLFGVHARAASAEQLKPTLTTLAQQAASKL
jgi:hypothetical protein